MISRKIWQAAEPTLLFRRRPIAVVRCSALAAFVILCIHASAESQEFQVADHYIKSMHSVSMRDGVQLFTIVYAPQDTSTTYPVMLFRTPYSIAPYESDEYRKSLGPSNLFAQERFIFVYQDVRGKFKSEGKFEVMKPPRPKPKGPTAADESTDTYDTIEWVLNNIPNHNGRVGQWGISYPGWQTVMGMIDAHPALKASSPQAPPADMFLGDDFHHNGAFRFMYTFHWLASNAATRKSPTDSRGPPVFQYGTPDGYQFFLDLGTVANVDHRYFQKRVPTWNEYMAHGVYDDYWKARDVLRYLKDIRHPVLNVAGWFDAEDFYGPMNVYYTIERETPQNQSTLVVGPWRHGGWSNEDGESLGDVRFGSNTAEYYRREIELPFFRHHLKDEPAGDMPEAIVFETGVNRWRRYVQWPPDKAVVKQLHLLPGGRLGFTAPKEADGSDSFVSDPRKPVPFSSEFRTTQGHTWMVEDQRFASRRPDVLVYQTEPLAEGLSIAGPLIANLFVTTTGTDADWIVKLIDVYPPDAPDDSPRGKQVRMGGYQMLLAGEVFRAKFRESFERPKPTVPGQPTAIQFDLRDKHHRFLKGHRIMVQVQSSWFPVIDRNPQQFMNIYQASEGDFHAATHHVLRSATHPSSLTLRVVPSEE